VHHVPGLGLSAGADTLHARAYAADDVWVAALAGEVALVGCEGTNEEVGEWGHSFLVVETVVAESC